MMKGVHLCPFNSYLFELGHAESQRMVIDKVNNISKRVYAEIQKEKLFSISSEPTNVQGYINEVLGEVWHIDPVLLQKA